MKRKTILVGIGAGLAGLLICRSPLPAQREAFTLLRLARQCQCAGIFRADRALLLGGGHKAIEFTCREALKGMVPGGKARVLRCPDQCTCPDVGRVPAGGEALLFLRPDPERPGIFKQMPGGVLPARSTLVACGRELLAAESDPQALAKVLAAQLGHSDPRAAGDALLALMAQPQGILQSVAETVRPPSWPNGSTGKAGSPHC